MLWARVADDDVVDVGDALVAAGGAVAGAAWHTERPPCPDPALPIAFASLARSAPSPPSTAAAGGADALALNWRNFGDGGHQATPAGLVVENFTHGMTLDNPQSRSVKTLFRLTPHIADFAIHRPIFTTGEEIAFRDGGGKPLRHHFSHRSA